MKKIASISAPGKAILCGQHAVVYGQDAIAFGVDLKCHANIFTDSSQGSNSNTLTFKMNISNQLKTFDFSEEILKISENIPKTKQKVEIQNIPVNEVEFGVEEFCHQTKENMQTKDSAIQTTLYKIALFCEIFDIDRLKYANILSQRHYMIQTSSEIPIGKGLGSSASFNSVLAVSLLIIFNLLTKTTKQFKPVINYLSKIFQKVEHGRPSGIDNFVSVYGGMVLFNKSKNPPFKLIQNPKIFHYLTEEMMIGFVDSGIQKNTKLAVSNVFEKYRLHENGDQKYKLMIEQIGTFSQQIISLLGSQNLQQQDVKRKFFQILERNHSYLRQFGLSNEQIEKIVSNYSVKNKSVAKITGAGMGGVVLIVGEKEFMQHQHLKSNYQIILSKMNTKGLQVQYF